MCHHGDGCISPGKVHSFQFISAGVFEAFQCQAPDHLPGGWTWSCPQFLRPEVVRRLQKYTCLAVERLQANVPCTGGLQTGFAHVCALLAACKFRVKPPGQTVRHRRRRELQDLPKSMESQGWWLRWQVFREPRPKFAYLQLLKNE